MNLKNNKIVISIIIFLILLISIVNINFFRSTVKSLISPEHRDKVKKIILGKKTIDYYNALKLKSSINYNQKLVPDSEFIELSFKDFSLDELINNDENSIQRKYFIEEFNNDLIFVDYVGSIFFIDKNIINDVKKFKSVNVKSNLNFDVNIFITLLARSFA